MKAAPQDTRSDDAASDADASGPLDLSQTVLGAASTLGILSSLSTQDESIKEPLINAPPVTDFVTSQPERQPAEDPVPAEASLPDVTDTKETKTLVAEQAPASDASASNAFAPELDDVEVGSAEALLPNVDGTAALKPDIANISLAGAIIQANPAFQVQGLVGSPGSSAPNDSDDLFRFSLTETGVFSAQLSGLTGDADVQLIQDDNSNGVVDRGEIVAWQWERGTATESIRSFLEAGDYIVRVTSHNEATTSYQLTTSFEAAPVDDQAFSIELVQLSGMDAFSTEAIAAIERAANFWDNIITGSSLNSPQTFYVGLYGSQGTDDLLAYAGPDSYQTLSDDRLIPQRGVAVLNLAYIERYNNDPDFLESVMRHELGHVFGLGIAWGDRGGNDWVDAENQVYRADSYAGQAYGDLLGESQAVDIPLDEDLSHWREDVFDVELMTPRAEPQGTSMPLSQVTIASLRDLGWNVNYGAAESFNLTDIA